MSDNRLDQINAELAQLLRSAEKLIAEALEIDGGFPPQQRRGQNHWNTVDAIFLEAGMRFYQALAVENAIPSAFSGMVGPQGRTLLEQLQKLDDVRYHLRNASSALTAAIETMETKEVKQLSRCVRGLNDIINHSGDSDNWYVRTAKQTLFDAGIELKR